VVCFFVQAEDGIRDRNVTGVQTCALPIWFRDYLQTGDDVFECQSFFHGGTDGSTFAKCGCLLKTRSHFSKRRFFLYRVVEKTQPLRLRFEDGARRQSRKVGGRCPGTGQDDSRGGGRLLSEGSRTLSQVSQATLPETRFRNSACGSRVPSGML